MSNVEAAGVSLDVLENTDATDVVTTDDENLGTILVGDEAFNFTALKVNLKVRIFNIKIIQRVWKKVQRFRRNLP